MATESEIALAAAATATTKAAEANVSATSASASASTATTKASEASASATSAAVNATTATTKAAEITALVASIQTSQGICETKADDSATSAEEASQSAALAGARATSAQNYATNANQSAIVATGKASEAAASATSAIQNFTSLDASKVDKITGKGLSTNDFTNTYKGQLDSLPTDLETKVDKVSGKGLSANDYTSAEKTKLAGIATAATANDTDANLKSRSNHIGTQTASTISDFIETVRSTVLTGLSLATNAAITATDTVLGALGKLQKQLTDHLDNTSNPHSVTKSQVGLGNVPNIDATNPANIVQSASFRFVSDTEKTDWNSKSPKVSPVFSGNAGFNTSSPRAKVEVAGELTSITSLLSPLSTESFAITDGGNLALVAGIITGTAGMYPFYLQSRHASGIGIPYPILLNPLGGNIGINNTSPTHSLTLSSSSTGYAHYNSVDQLTNYERVRFYWNGDSYIIATEKGGAVTQQRNITIQAPVITLEGAVKATQYYVDSLNVAPLSANSQGIAGEIRITATHIYVCVATNTWVRTALTTW